MTDELGPQLRQYIDDLSSRVELETVMQPRRRRHRRPKLVAIVAVLAAVIALVAALALIDDSDPKRLTVKGPSTDPLDSTALGSAALAHPGRVLLSGSSLYWLDALESGNTRLVRYDTNEGHIVAERSLDGANDMALTPQGQFVSHSAQGSASVQLLTADTLQPVRSFPIDAHVMRIAELNGTIWVSSFVSVERFDATSGRSLGKLDLDPQGLVGRVWPRDMEADSTSGRVFVAWTDAARNVGLTEYGSDGEPVAERADIARSESPPPIALRGIAVGDHTAFVMSQQQGASTWLPVRSSDLAAASDTDVRGSTDLRLRRAGDNVWALDYNDGRLACVDRRPGKTLWTTRVENPDEIAADSHNLFLFTISGIERAPLPQACGA
jgi:hypothetical protein